MNELHCQKNNLLTIFYYQPHYRSQIISPQKKFPMNLLSNTYETMSKAFYCYVLLLHQYQRK